MAQHTDYPRWVHFDGKPSVVAQTPEDEAELLAANEAPDEVAEKATIRGRLAELNAPPPHHKTGLDKLRVLLADAEAMAAAAEEPGEDVPEAPSAELPSEQPGADQPVAE